MFLAQEDKTKQIAGHGVIPFFNSQQHIHNDRVSEGQANNMELVKFRRRRRKRQGQYFISLINADNCMNG